MIIPVDQLNPDTLNQVIREFLMRQGEDWGLAEGHLDDAIQQARDALVQGNLVLYWDENEESLTILSKEEVNQSGLG
ncbi:YheU family protein [Saccharospirillum salsuginis]|uniref:YheU family protein n=1 Tax=Saccharospirillum salsuginis TaxID=418750 RepID=A0A918NKN8_9GAMM|nr:YheU family protein [Saccharospirillum salsuginis]GGX75716.1 hypothetical protein GCM10007392_48520 [Saccharospirillum salsuginis]